MGKQSTEQPSNTQKAPHPFQWVELPCAVCESTSCVTLGYRGGEAHKHRRGLTGALVQCSHCSHIYPQPMPIVTDPNALYHGVDEYFVNHDPTTKIERSRSLLESLSRHSGFVGRMLDIGAGRGEMLYTAKQLGWEAHGVEASEEFASYARETYGVNVMSSTLQDAHYPDAWFDLVTLGAVLEHLYHPKQILQEVHRILKPDGLVWVDVPNEESLYNKIANLYFKLQGKNWVSQLSPTFEPYHVQGFTQRSLQALLENTGFTTVSLTIYTGRVLLSRSHLRERLEFWAACAISFLAKHLRSGPYMELVARKDK